MGDLHKGMPVQLDLVLQQYAAQQGVVLHHAHGLLELVALYGDVGAVGGLKGSFSLNLHPKACQVLLQLFIEIQYRGAGTLFKIGVREEVGQPHGGAFVLQADAYAYF